VLKIKIEIIKKAAQTGSLFLFCTFFWDIDAENRKKSFLFGLYLCQICPKFHL